ncbi:aquaporin NIP1-1 isoform X2 [Amborella trichopoda]|uniref:aquaporin NIP1-1 isoform X2 n=1 Tax=Amborella trichopoda TaxID=13333 RepID=UPI0009C18276|nr:aquaporin NIP1-1 isoform X2 [Amborella trichopoda]|eukprot:XP_020524871.1 aquaporin NIP1-1 isoform X2 [Amborella trichopoda]
MASELSNGHMNVQINGKSGENEIYQIEDGVSPATALHAPKPPKFQLSVTFIQKIIAEILGTYFVIFAGCASVVVNLSKGSVTFPGICIVWGLVVMVMVYSVGHISGAHFNPAVTIAFATCRRFPWKQVPPYVLAQVLGSTLASGTLHLLFGGKSEHFPGTIPIGELAGIAVGATVLLNVLYAGPISGASMNPARSLGPAIVGNRYESIWVYVVGPICGTTLGAWAYNLIRFTDKPLRQITKSGSFLKSRATNSQV